MTRISRRNRRSLIRKWAVASLILMMLAVLFLFLGAISSDYKLGFWPTLTMWVCCFLSFCGSGIAMVIASDLEQGR